MPPYRGVTRTDEELATRVDLDVQMREVLIQLAVISHVPAGTWNPSGRSSDNGKMGGTRPPGDLGEAYFARRYGPPFNERTSEHPGCRTDEQRTQVLEDARNELQHLRRRAERPRVKEETKAQRDTRIVGEGEGFPTKPVAVRFRCSERDVRRARTAAGRDPDDGTMPREEHHDREARRSRAHELREEKGMSVTQIARVLGCDKATISRDLRRTA